MRIAVVINKTRYKENLRLTKRPTTLVFIIFKDVCQKIQECNSLLFQKNDFSDVESIERKERFL